jgi:hypothetical protein
VNSFICFLTRPLLQDTTRKVVSASFMLWWTSERGWR